jgi:hypothetical protein
VGARHHRAHHGAPSRGAAGVGARLARLLLGEDLMVQADGNGFSISEFIYEGGGVIG